MHKVYVSYEVGSKGRYTLEEMKTLYKKDVEKTEYPSFDIWLADMIKSGVFVEKNEPYRYFKTAKKTAQENNLTLVEGNSLSDHKMLFDFSFIDSLDIPSREKEIIKQDAEKYCSICNRTAYVIEFPDNFTTLGAYVDFAYQKVYDAKTYTLMYVILEAVHIKYSHAERNSTCDRYFKKNIVELDVSRKSVLTEEIEV